MCCCYRVFFVFIFSLSVQKRTEDESKATISKYRGLIKLFKYLNVNRN